MVVFGQLGGHGRDGILETLLRLLGPADRVVGDNEHAVIIARALQREGFDVRAIRPPSVPPGTARLRISVNAGLAAPDLDRFASVLGAVTKEIGLWAPS